MAFKLPLGLGVLNAVIRPTPHPWRQVADQRAGRVSVNEGRGYGEHRACISPWEPPGNVLHLEIQSYFVLPAEKGADAESFFIVLGTRLKL